MQQLHLSHQVTATLLSKVAGHVALFPVESGDSHLSTSLLTLVTEGPHYSNEQLHRC